MAHLEFVSVPGCPKTQNTSDFNFQMLELQVCTSILSLNCVLSISEIYVVITNIHIHMTKVNLNKNNNKKLFR